MARLSALYRFTDFADDAADTNNSGVQPDEQYSTPTERKIYPPTSGNAPVVNTIVTLNSTDFDCGANACAGRVFYDTNNTAGQISGSPDNDRVYVWIDQARKITGRLSWYLAPPADVANFEDCSDGISTGDGDNPGGRAPCQELTVFLEFPFRFVDGATPNAATGFDKTHQLSLKTIVGRR